MSAPPPLPLGVSCRCPFSPCAAADAPARRSIGDDGKATIALADGSEKVKAMDKVSFANEPADEHVQVRMMLMLVVVLLLRLVMVLLLLPQLLSHLPQLLIRRP